MIHSKAPLVSIVCITFNHKGYIAKALEGFLLQKTSFPFEVIVHDDASTDGTSGIIREYESLYPDKIKPIYQTENQYRKGVRITALAMSHAKGKYIALCEGDDYWVDDCKLQKQVDFLESHSDFSFSSHFVTVVDSNGNEYKDQYHKSKEINTFDDITKKHFIPTCSLVFRNIIKHPSWFFDKQLLSGDMAMELMLAHHGKGYHFQSTMAVHLKHESGITNTAKHQNVLNRILNKKILYEGIDVYTNGQYKSIRQALASVYLQYAVVSFKTYNFPRAVIYCFKFLLKDPFIVVRRGRNITLVLKNLLRK